MKTVEKKISTKFFDDVNNKLKNFELRRDEDNIEIGDTLILKEWNGKEFTGRECTRKVIYILRGYEGLEDGYCIYGVE